MLGAPAGAPLRFGLLPRSTNGRPRRRSGWQPEVRKGAPGQLFILDHRDQAHGAGASGARQDIQAEGPLHQDGPRKAPRSVGIIWASEFRCYRPFTSATDRVPDRWANSMPRSSVDIRCDVAELR